MKFILSVFSHKNKKQSLSHISMKISLKRNLFTILFYFIISGFFFTSCQNDEANKSINTKLIGTWHQISKKVDGTIVSKDSTHMLLQINANQICILCDSSSLAVKSNTIINRSGWSYTNGLFDLAIDLPTSWIPSVTQSSLSLERKDFTKDGTISTTILSFERFSNFVIQ
jgi:hypothetical protein